jgi:uncharacterized DUF497 family protein
VDFRWNDWNLEHVTVHGVEIEEAEHVVEQAFSPFPLQREDDKWLVWGRGLGDRLLQVVFILDPDGAVFIIHARPLTEREKRRYRRRMQ